MDSPNPTIDPRTAHAIAQGVGAALVRLLGPRLAPGAEAPFWIWLRPDRMIISIDPLAVKSIDQVLSPRFTHHLSTALAGRRVLATNSRGVYFQVAYWPARPAHALKSLALDLSQQPGPLAVPVGETKFGPLWLDLREVASALIGGSSGMGKTTLFHAWIQALLHGERAKLFLWDGKEDVEFSRYHGGKVYTSPSLPAVLEKLLAEVDARRQALRQAGCPSVEAFNQANPSTPYLPLVLFIDEAAFVPADCQATVKDLVARGRAAGVYPVLGTQRTSSEEVQGLVKANLVTRIAFHVPEWQDSRVVLGRVGAEKLPIIKGRLLMEWRGRLVQAQAYRVDLPQLESGQPSQADLSIFRRAAAEKDGKLSIPILVEWGMSEWTARQSLDRWTARGWLAWGEKRDRYLSPALRSQFSQTSQSSQSGSNRPQTGLKAAQT